MESRNRKCIFAAVASLVAILVLTTWLGYLAPTFAEAYGVSPETLQYNWLIIPIAFAILASIVVAARTSALKEERRCFWIVSMVLLFPVSTIALIARIMWKR